jgi:hypothetical protein
MTLSLVESYFLRRRLTRALDSVVAEKIVFIPAAAGEL